MSQEYSTIAVVGGQDVRLSTGVLAEQAGGAVSIYFGDCMLLATATMSSSVREGLDFFPMSVDYEEKMYAAGRIPGSFFRREGRATTASILVSRLTDRPLRPLFPKGMRNEVQIIITTLSSDGENFMDVMAVNAASAALAISDIPWNGPVAAVRVGRIDGEFVLNPSIEAMENSDLNLRLSGTADAIIMVEAGADEVPEDVMVKALSFGHAGMQPIIEAINKLREMCGKEKAEPVQHLQDEVLVAAVSDRVSAQIDEILQNYPDRHDRGEHMGALRDTTIEAMMAENEELEAKALGEAFGSIMKKAIRQRILDGVRPDGRDYTTIRQLTSDTGLSPRAHGSGLFKRGETQVLSIAALGTLREAQKLDGLNDNDTKRYLHHYNFPPFSTGETWPLRGPKRREIGHGELARTALLPVIPSEDDFPYTIRVVSEVLSSNGSTSQASVCASTLALMDCGVPIKRPVAGIAMGLVTDGEGEYAILTDIQGMEDHLGDMDFKVAGTREGITALQMDIKISGLSEELMAEALNQALQARLEILDHMEETIESPREELNEWAPRLLSIKINPDKIGAIIGKGGSTIRSLEEVYEVSVDIQEDGTVFIAGTNKEKSNAALRQVELLTKEVEAGETYTGKVVRITDFGAFVELIPGTDGMVHISQLSPERVPSVDSVVQIGDEIMVMVISVAPDGKIRLSRRAVLEGLTLEEAIASDMGGNKRGGGGGNRRGGGDRRGGGGNRRGGGGGNRDRRR